MISKQSVIKKIVTLFCFHTPLLFLSPTGSCILFKENLFSLCFYSFTVIDVKLKLTKSQLNPQFKLD